MKIVRVDEGFMSRLKQIRARKKHEEEENRYEDALRHKRL
jgi:hypothetical protein